MSTTRAYTEYSMQSSLIEAAQLQEWYFGMRGGAGGEYGYCEDADQI
jgi:hypothetical protein